ncbi:MAG: type II toxin-antitoxin system VapC family toxin [Candidatus Eremiobacteraeota bacterium]|nr:type II toxin-antitoxin system VapC family toxin [Candidatus Eremiobacteraeota bacterium]
MVIDTSAIVAIFAKEPPRAELVEAITSVEQRLMSAVSYYETNIVLLLRFGAEVQGDFDLWLDESRIEIVPFTRRQAQLARQAYRRYGKGLHAAKLNLADCAAYALATERDDTLLFVGEDFLKTDVRRH